MSYRLGLAIPIIGTDDYSCSKDIERVLNGLLYEIPETVQLNECKDVIDRNADVARMSINVDSIVSPILNAYKIQHKHTVNKDQVFHAIRSTFALEALRTCCFNSYFDSSAYINRFNYEELRKITEEVLVLFTVPEDYYNESLFQELANVTGNNVCISELNKNTIEVINEFKSNSNYKTKLTIHFLGLPLMKFQDYILTALNSMNNCQYYSVINLYNSGVVDLLTLIDSISDNKECYMYQNMSKSLEIEQFVISNDKRKLILGIILTYGTSLNNALVHVETDSTRIDLFVVNTKIPLTDLDKETKFTDTLKWTDVDTVKAAKNKQKLGIVVPFSKSEDKTRIVYSMLYVLSSVLGNQLHLSDNIIAELVNEYNPANIYKILTKICNYLQLNEDTIYNYYIEIHEIINNTESNTTMLIKALQTFLWYANERDIVNKYENEKEYRLFGKSRTDITVLFVVPGYYNVSRMYKPFAEMTGHAVRVYNYNGENIVIKPSGTTKARNIHIEILNCEEGKDGYNICLVSGLLYMRNRFDYVANFNIYTSTPINVNTLLDAIGKSDEDLILLPTTDVSADESYIVSNGSIPKVFTVTNQNVFELNISVTSTMRELDKFPFPVHLLKKEEEDLGGTKTLYLAGYKVIVKDNNKITGGYREINPWFLLCVFLIAAIVVYLIARICKQCMHKQCRHRCMQK